MTFDGTCERGGVQRSPQEIEERSPAALPLPLWAHNQNLASELDELSKFAVISTTKCFAMTTDLLDHVQAVRSAYEAASSRDSFVGRRRITPPVPLGRRGSEWQALFGYSALIWLIWLT
jgi:hypothetical protein